MKYTQSLKLLLATVAKSSCVAKFKDVLGLFKYLFRGRVCMGLVCMVRDLVAELVMGRVCYNPSLSRAEFVMGRDVPESVCTCMTWVLRFNAFNLRFFVNHILMTSVSSLTKLRNASAFLFFASNRLSRLLDIVISLICKILSFTNASFLSVTWTLQKNKHLREYAQVSICMTIVGSTETPHTIQNHPKATQYHRKPPPNILIPYVKSL